MGARFEHYRKLKPVGISSFPEKQGPWLRHLRRHTMRKATG